jgi:RNA polymerase sigma factor (sigma-70 family)
MHATNCARGCVGRSRVAGPKTFETLKSGKEKFRSTNFLRRPRFLLAAHLAPANILPCAMNPTGAEIQNWYLTEVEPHRPALRAWLLARFPALPDIDNIVQESLSRVLKARASGTIRSAQALLFTTARNLALDAVRRQKVVQFSPLAEVHDSYVLHDTTDVYSTVTKQEELELLTKAVQSLPERLRRIVTLRTVYGLTHKQIADRMGLSLSSVDKLMAQALQLCASYFAKGKA